MEEPDVAKVFRYYENTLKTLFEFYSKFDKVEAYKYSEMGVVSLSYKSFIKLINQQRLLPNIITKDELMIIYKVIMKNKVGKIGSLNFEEFKESLVRIIVKGKNRLANPGDKRPRDNTKSLLLFDMEGVTANTLRELFKYMKLAPEMSKRAFVKKLIELQDEGVKDEILRRRQLVPESP